MASRKPKKQKPLSPQLAKLRQACASNAASGNWPGLLALLQRCPPNLLNDAEVGLYQLQALEKQQMLPPLLQQAKSGVSQHPRDPRYWSFLSHALRLSGDVDGAVEPMRKAVKLAGPDAGLFNSLGSALKETGQFEEAENWLQRAVKMDPRNTKAWWNLSDIRSDHETAVAQLRSLLGKGNLPEPELVHFSLFRHLDRLGELDAAFSHLSQANQLRYEKFKPDAATDRKLTDQIVSYFETNLSVAGDNESFGDEAIFVFGMPRSGTTLVEQVLACHSQVQGGNELTALNVASAQVRARHRLEGEFPFWLEQLDQAGWKEIGDKYLVLTEALRGSFARLTDKSLLNFRAAGLITSALPGAHMVHVHRSPCDQAFGLFKQNFGDGILFSYHFENIASAIADHNRLLQLWTEKLPAKNYLPLAYESLAANPDTQIPQLLQGCALEPEAACLQPYKAERTVRTLSATQVRQPIGTASINSWEKYREQLQPMLEQLEKYQLI